MPLERSLGSFDRPLPHMGWHMLLHLLLHLVMADQIE